MVVEEERREREGHSVNYRNTHSPSESHSLQYMNLSIIIPDTNIKGSSDSISAKRAHVNLLLWFGMEIGI